MKILFNNKIILALLLLVTLVVKAEPPVGYDFLPYDVGIQNAIKNDKKVFAYFGRFGCGFCDKANKETFVDENLKKTLSAHYVLVYVNSESMDRLSLPTGERITEMQLGERMNTTGTPVFFFLEADGREIIRVYGVQTPQEFLLLDKFINGNHYKKMDFNAFKRKQ